MILQFQNHCMEAVHPRYAKAYNVNRKIVRSSSALQITSTRFFIIRSLPLRISQDDPTPPPPLPKDNNERKEKKELMTHISSGVNSAPKCVFSSFSSKNCTFQIIFTGKRHFFRASTKEPRRISAPRRKN